LSESEDLAQRHRLSALGLFVDTIGSLPGLLLPMFVAVIGTRGTDLGALPVIAAVLGAGLLLRWLKWLRFSYTLEHDEVRIEQGLFERSARTIPFDRIADVTIEQPALARLLSLAMVRFETGGGKSDEGVLQYVSEQEAARIREVVRARPTSSVQAASAEQPDSDEAELLFHMDRRRIMILGFYSFSLAAIAVPIGLAFKFDELLPGSEYWIGLAEEEAGVVSAMPLGKITAAMLAGLVLIALVGIVTGVILTALRESGFRLERTSRGLRRRRGLLSHTDVAMPLHRTMAASIATGPIRRRHGWYGLGLVSLGGGEEATAAMDVAPLARLDEVARLLEVAGLIPPSDDLQFRQADPGPMRDRIVLRSLLLLGAGLAWWLVGLPYGWVVMIPAAFLALRDWLAWRQEWRAIGNGQLFLKSRWWKHIQVIAPERNVQTVTIARGPLERRRGLATIHFGLVNSHIRFAAIPLAEALTLRDRIMDLVAPVDFSHLGRKI
jgi:putative membrane protein